MSPDPPAPRRRLHPAVGVVIALALLMVVTVALGLWHLRRDTLAAQQRGLANLASSAADDLERGLQGVVLALQATRDDVREARIVPGSAEAPGQLHRRALLLGLVRDLWVVGRDGTVRAASGSADVPAPASFRPPLDTLADAALAIGEPYADLATHDLSVAVAMRYAADDSGGWVVAALPAAGLLGAFRAAGLPPDARMAVFRADGTLLAGSLDQHGKGNGAALLADALAGSGDDELRRFADGTTRIVQHRSLEPHGVRLVLTRDIAAGLARWQELRRNVALAVAAVLAVVATLLWRLLRAERAELERAAHARRLEQQLARAQKLDALGSLAGGVAHDFNNILAAVTGFGEMARDGAAPGSAQERQLDQVLAAAQRGKAVIERILSFSRGGARSASVFAVQPVVEQVLQLLAGSLGPGIVLERDLAAEPLALRGDPTALFEAVMNLATNARQAMPEGGTLRVRVAPRRLDAELAASHGRIGAGDYVEIEVRDSGRGIEPDVMERLFEPFFTTRGRAGTGLGLAVVHGVADEFGGGVDVASVPGQGSRFALLLPRVHELPAAPPAAAEPAERAAGHGETVLVVDDEPVLVELAEELLARLGYEPIGCTDPRQALERVREDPQRYDLVLSDEVMPGLQGTELARQLKAIRADLPIVIASGYGGPQLAQRAAEAGVARVLAKPLQAAELARELAAVLGEAATASAAAPRPAPPAR